MFTFKAILFGLISTLVSTTASSAPARAGGPQPAHKASSSSPPPDVWGEDTGPQRHDIMLKSGPGDWIAAAVRALMALEGFDIPSVFQDVNKQGKMIGDQLKITLDLQNASQIEVWISNEETTSLQFNYGDYWWPNALVQAMIFLGGYDGVRDYTLSAGSPADVYTMFGKTGATETEASKLTDEEICLV
nr:uncharacterized protein CI109_000232 [Kwoniella shandongensis]KAA5531391.1 hypothetical protein CI109_000232 [Kwoniella shandongensis]